MGLELMIRTSSFIRRKPGDEMCIHPQDLDKAFQFQLINGLFLIHIKTSFDNVFFGLERNNIISRERPCVHE